MAKSTAKRKNKKRSPKVDPNSKNVAASPRQPVDGNRAIKKKNSPQPNKPTKADKDEQAAVATSAQPETHQVIDEDTHHDDHPG